MDLKSGALFWPHQNCGGQQYGSLQKNIRCEVAVVGAGLTGALVAYSLTRAGTDVVLLDKRRVAGGSTSASTALILYEIDTPLQRLIRMIGKAKAIRSYHLCQKAISQIKAVVDELQDDCGFERKQSLLLASRASDVQDLKKEFQARKRAGFRVEYLTPSDLRSRFALTAPGALLSADAAEIDPYRFTLRLAENSVPRGLRIFDRTEITRFETSARRVTLRTNNNFIVTANKIVLAAGFESQCYLKKKLVKLKSTYAIATEPLDELDGRHKQLLIWETARPYFYLRTTRDGRIMIGGEDEDFQDPDRRDRLIPKKTRILERKIRKLFPRLKGRTEFAWAGTFGETHDSLPYIGTRRGSPHIIYALCYGANGTNFAMLAANIIRDRIQGKRNADAQIFSLDR
jgi:glycine/D-amino acid oxidase-like deaminating enzyme